ncbi:conserved hypothetical protein [Altererythrobacter sp. B11]|uniref:twin-arginine translocase TatA/TatE family subunit n=1 Tax=Altererythrobacter sp. B11 TaxID=2060312 RepID=UPI000DC7245F|nr:twin-arginine translocase TatA/TatE family subunit [Altererythrobacter sp. B11]BBC73451.1 conserved hypothetical protein [Altererythrobacter sp. B11]
MGSFSSAHWIVVMVVALLLFGRGRISESMGDFGKGIRAFRQGLSDEDAPAPTPALAAVEAKEQPVIVEAAGEPR